MKLTVIKADMFRIIKGEISKSTGVISSYTNPTFGDEDTTHRYFSTSANQKLSVSSIFVVRGLFMSLIPAKPVGVDKYWLNLAIALRARSR
jgi:hypothetical protein